MAGKARQRGISMFGLLFVLVVCAAVGAVVLQVLPSAMEFRSATRALDRAAQGGGTVQDVRLAFDRYADVDNVNTVRGKDLEVTKNGENIIASFAYEKEFHLFGPAWLTMKYASKSNPRPGNR
jgi:type II secretory pathway pseudopilin PulG